MARGGRPVGTTKNPNRLRIWKSRGRTTNAGEIFIKKSRGRPRVNLMIDKSLKVQNPDSNNMIIVNGSTFKEIVFRKGRYIYDDKKNILINTSKLSEKAFKNGMKKYELLIVNEHDPVQQMAILERRVKGLLIRELYYLQGIKFNIGLDITMTKVDNDSQVIEKEFFVVAKVSQLTDKTGINQALNIQKDRILRQIDRYTKEGSGWAVHRINRHYLSINQYKPLRGHGYIVLSKEINNKKATYC